MFKYRRISNMTLQQRTKRKMTTMKQSLSLRRSNHLLVVVVTNHVPTLLFGILLLGCKQIHTSTAQVFTPTDILFKPTVPIVTPAVPIVTPATAPLLPSQQQQPQQQPRPPNFGYLPCTICGTGETMTSAAAYIPIGTVPFINYLLTCLELEIMSLNVQLSPSNCQYIQFNTTIPQDICDCRKVNAKPTVAPILIQPTQIPTSIPISIKSNIPTTAIPVQTTIPVPIPIQSNIPTTKVPTLTTIVPTTAVPIPTNIPTIAPVLTTIPSLVPTAQPVVTNTPTVAPVPQLVTTTAPEFLSIVPSNTPSSQITSSPTTVVSLYQVNGTIRLRLFYVNETMNNETIQQFEISYTNFLLSKLNSSLYTNITSKFIEQQLLNDELSGPYVALSRNGTKNRTLSSFMNDNNENNDKNGNNSINSNNNSRKNRLERSLRIKRSLQQQDMNISFIPPLDIKMFIGALSPDSNSTTFIETVITVSDDNLEELLILFQNISTVLNTTYFETVREVSVTSESAPIPPPVSQPESGRNGLNTFFIVAVVLLVFNLLGFIGFKVYTTYIRTNEGNSNNNNSDDEDNNNNDAAPEINPSPSLVGVTVTMLEADGKENFLSDGDTSLSAPELAMYGVQKTRKSTPPVIQAGISTNAAVGTTLTKQAMVSDIKGDGSGTISSTATVAVTAPSTSTGLADIPEESISQSNGSMLYMDQIEVFSQAEQMRFMEGSAVDDDDDDGEKDLSYAFSLGISETSYDSTSDIIKEVKSTSLSIFETGITTTTTTTTTRGGHLSSTSALDITTTEDEEINRLFANPNTMIHRTVIVPPGKLGIAIDTTIEGPVVIEIFTNSPLDGKLFVGDIIVAIDDVDTRAMSKSTLTDLMAQNTHKSRTFSILSTNDIGL